MSMNKVEIPEYFICPISLQIMADPVTVASGITYDRRSIEQWLLTNHHNTICPVTKHPLSAAAAGLTPNHTLRRLIHAWCILHAPHRAPAPAPKTPLTKFSITNLIRCLAVAPESRLDALRKLEAAALDDDRNRAYMVEAELPKKLMHFVVACRRAAAAAEGLEEALRILYIIRNQLARSKVALHTNDEIIDSLIWIFECDRFRDDQTVKSHAAHALRVVVRKAADSDGVLERLKPEFFRTAAINLRGSGASVQRALLHVLLEACAWGRNRAMMVECSLVFELVEVELGWCPAAPEKKKTAELVVGIMYQLCQCAEGRAQLLSHAAGVAVVTRRMLEDERAVLIVWQIAAHAATKGVVEEMMRVGTVANLCLVMVADGGAYVKEKARKILRMHFDAWKDSPCIEMNTLTRYAG